MVFLDFDGCKEWYVMEEKKIFDSAWKRQFYPKQFAEPLPKILESPSPDILEIMHKF
jgi:hypothetical protein